MKRRDKMITVLLSFALAAAVLMVFASCKSNVDKDSDGRTDTSLSEKADGGALKDAADKLGEAAGNAGDAINEAMDGMTEGMTDGASGVTGTDTGDNSMKKN